MVLMWIRHLFLGFCGLAAGVGVSAGTFAFLLVIGIIPRLVGKCNRAADALHFENAVILGGICGNLLSDFTSARSAGLVFLRDICRNFCRLHGGCPGGNSEHVSDYVPADKVKDRAGMDYACNGARKNDRFAVLFSRRASVGTGGDLTDFVR